VDAGGVAFRGGAEELYAANLRLRTAGRVVVRVGQFPAEAFHELERRAERLPWGKFASGGRRVRFRVTCRKSRLYHSDAVAERLARVVERATCSVADPGAAADEDRESESQLFVVRLFHDRCTVSADASGALLHRRGYRQAVGKAPLRETLAAAMLLATGWDGAAPLLDPMCGSGTIAIEGALIARRMAPGLGRRFACQDWPEFDPRAWERAVDEARARELPASPVPIQASDRDAGAVDAAAENALRAGVAADVELATRAVSAVEPPPGPGWWVSNPPYGVRVGDRDRLRNLYAQIGHVARRRCPGWCLALLSADRGLDGQLGLPLRDVLRTTNGGIGVRVTCGRVPAVRGVRA
jgi:putative N6-adenine-specific DNA methylase